MKKYLKIVIPILVILVGFFLMKFLGSFNEKPEHKPPTPRAKIAESVVVQLSDVDANISVYGKSISSQSIDLYSEVSGAVINGSVPFLPAQSFKKGQLIYKIDDRQAKLDLNSSKSDLLNALASLIPEIKVDFSDEYDNWQTFFNSCGFENNLSPLPEIDNQKLKLFLSRFNVYKLYFAVRNNEIRLGKHYFYAPFNGSIVSVALREGSIARQGALLGSIINLQNLEVEVAVPAEDVKWINRKKSVALKSSELNKEWSGKVARIGKSIDERTQTVQVYISVSSSGNSGLFDGIFLEAIISGKKITKAVKVPRKSVYDNSYVYIIKNGEFEYRKVDVARREADSVIVKGGFNDGDTLVVELMQGIAPGMKAQARFAN
jgi:multidrug efflux pump subunit AcrA (membrane-fusion protein)